MVPLTTPHLLESIALVFLVYLTPAVQECDDEFDLVLVMSRCVRALLGHAILAASPQYCETG